MRNLQERRSVSVSRRQSRVFRPASSGAPLEAGKLAERQGPDAYDQEQLHEAREHRVIHVRVLARHVGGASWAACPAWRDERQV